MILQEIDDIFRSSKVLLMGDFMLDVYTVGNVSRLSPEAPVPLLTVKNETSRPGGGGNAILNLLSLGMEVEAIGRVGDDFAGQTFLQMIGEPKVSYQGVIIERGYQTPVKKRMIAENHYLLRVDYETISPLTKSSEEQIKMHLQNVIKSVSVIAISDYGKGFFTSSLLQFVIELSKKENIPLIIDPKGRDFLKYRGATVIKPNFAEAMAASGCSSDTPLEQIAHVILKQTNIQTLIVTRGKDGISLFYSDGSMYHFPVDVHQILDVTGAGDTVLAIITAALANRIDLISGAYLANIGASIAIECLGCARVKSEQIKERYYNILKNNAREVEPHVC